MALERLIVAVDPGQTTGVGILALREDNYELLEALQLEGDTAHHELQKLITHYSTEYEVHLVIEQFDKRPGVINPDFSAKFVERDIDNNVTGYQYKHKQIPGAAKFFIKEARNNKGKGDALIRFGLYQTGLKHANDALRHAVTYAVDKLKYKPIIYRGWPKPKDDD